MNSTSGLTNPPPLTNQWDGVEAAQAWEAVGGGLATPQAHVDALRQFAEVVGLA